MEYWFKAVVFNTNGRESIIIHLLMNNKNPSSAQILRQASSKLLIILKRKFFLEFISCEQEVPQVNCNCISCKYYRQENNALPNKKLIKERFFLGKVVTKKVSQLHLF